LNAIVLFLPFEAGCIVDDTVCSDGVVIDQWARFSQGRK